MNLQNDFFLKLAYALGTGLLIGLERAFETIQKNKKDPHNESITESHFAGFIGLRTFTVLSLTGFMLANAQHSIPNIVPVGLVCISLLIITMYYRAKEFGYGITTEVAAIGTFILGVLSNENPRIAGILALTITILLASKRFTRKTITRMRRVELNDTIKFLVAIFIILPLLPDEYLDPLQVLNPHKVGLLVILISGISFVGYFATRIFGTQKGLGLTGVFGGMTSSTAVTVAMSIEAKKNPSLIKICAFSTIIANATMFVRVLVIVAVLDVALMEELLMPIGGMAVIAMFACALLWYHAKGTAETESDPSQKIKLSNPFSVGPALKFALFFIFILFIIRIAQDHYGDSGLYLAASLSGLADVDAITLSISEQTLKGLLSHNVGSIAITIAVVANSVVKSGIAFYSGGIQFGKLVAVSLGLATLVGFAIALFP